MIKNIKTECEKLENNINLSNNTDDENAQGSVKRKLLKFKSAKSDIKEENEICHKNVEYMGNFRNNISTNGQHSVVTAEESNENKDTIHDNKDTIHKNKNSSSVFDNLDDFTLTVISPHTDILLEKFSTDSDNINKKLLRNVRKTVNGIKSNNEQKKEKNKRRRTAINGIQTVCSIMDRVVPVTCEICNKLFKNRKSYRNHLIVHDPLKTVWKCHICGSVLSQKKHLLTHIEKHEKIWKCDICGKEMTYKVSLTLHMREHLDDKKFMCDFCGKRFVASSCLVRHRRTHTHVSPYGCKECNKVFAQRVCYRLHQLNHHNGKPKYNCEICGKGFIIKCHISKHMKTHEK